MQATSVVDVNHVIVMGVAISRQQARREHEAIMAEGVGERGCRGSSGRLFPRAQQGRSTAVDLVWRFVNEVGGIVDVFRQPIERLSVCVIGMGIPGRPGRSRQVARDQTSFASEGRAICAGCSASS
jgi:hypothetical protein